MAKSTCVKCGGTEFELVETTPKKSHFVFSFVQCAQCGGVVGVMDFYNIGNVLKQIGEKLGVRV